MNDPQEAKMVAEDKLTHEQPGGIERKGDPSAKGRVTLCPVRGGGCKIIHLWFDLCIKGESGTVQALY